jgi:metal-sulfur cluster biosynthetic enzyme
VNSENAPLTTPPGPAEPSPVEQRAWSELRQLYDPEIPVNIVELGLVYAVQATPLPTGGYRIAVLMTVTSPGCDMSEYLRADAEARLRRLPDVREVEVEVTFDPPWTPEMMSESARLLLNL